MLVADFSKIPRGNRTITTNSNLVVIEGGLAGSFNDRKPSNHKYYCFSRKYSH